MMGNELEKKGQLFFLGGVHKEVFPCSLPPTGDQSRIYVTYVVWRIHDVISTLYQCARWFSGLSKPMLMFDKLVLSKNPKMIS